LFLDEPTTGLDPATRMEVWAVVEDLQQNTGMTVLRTCEKKYENLPA
jgi:ABC-type multidrug transport system ATPase subunit